MTRNEQVKMLNDIAATREKQDLIMERLDNLENMLEELQLIRKGNEAFVYGEEVKDSEEVDLEDIEDV